MINPSNILFLHIQTNLTIAFGAVLVHVVANLVQFGAVRSHGLGSGQGENREGEKRIVGGLLTITAPKLHQ